jgi:hypothetical protein
LSMERDENMRKLTYGDRLSYLPAAPLEWAVVSPRFWRKKEQTLSLSRETKNVWQMPSRMPA